MQYASCDVRVNNNLKFVVHKERVTAPEIVVLRQVHGHDAVINIIGLDTDKRPHREEFDRLCKVYKERRVREIFPGALPQLPVKLSDIGVAYNNDDEDEDDGDAAPKRRGRPKKTASVEVQAGDLAD